MQSAGNPRDVRQTKEIFGAFEFIFFLFLNAAL
jgi:hypothetical protein